MTAISTHLVTQVHTLKVQIEVQIIQERFAEALTKRV